MLSWTELETENQLLALSKNEGPARVSGAFCFGNSFGLGSVLTLLNRTVRA